MLDKSKYEKAPEHIKGLKDIKELSLTANPSYEPYNQENRDDSSSANKSPFICPITGLEMNGNFKFYYLYTCGCVFSERAYKTIQNDKRECLKCDKKFTDNDLIIINPSEEELNLNETKLKARKELAAKLKAEKTSSKQSSNVSKEDSSSKKISSDSVTKLKRPIEATFSASTSGSKSNESSSSKKVKSIQEDPNASDVYKSIFNTCDKAKNQQKAHWVTFNPLYN